MGSFNYYIEIKTDKQTLENMVLEYNQNETYQEAFHFGNFRGSDGYNAGFVCVIDNFLPTNHLIYNFLSHFNLSELYIKTNGIERIYDFVRKAEFINFMYGAWENKIDFAYNQFGVILINHKNYYKTRNKLYKKYYKKIPNLLESDNQVLE